MTSRWWLFSPLHLALSQPVPTPRPTAQVDEVSFKNQRPPGGIPWTWGQMPVPALDLSSRAFPDVMCASPARSPSVADSGSLPGLTQSVLEGPTPPGVRPSPSFRPLLTQSYCTRGTRGSGKAVLSPGKEEKGRNPRALGFQPRGSEALSVAWDPYL